MSKQCSYCGAPLTLAKRMRGEVFCSAEHSERRHQELSQTAFERVMNLQGMPAAESVASDTPAPTQPQSLVRLWIFVVAGALAVVALGIFLFSPTSSKGRSAPASMPAPSAAPAVPAKVAPSPARSLPVPVPEPLQAAAAKLGKSTVSIEASRSSWVVACADGKIAFAKLFVAGARNTLPFTQSAIVRSGNPAATHIELNGKPVDMPASPPGIVVLELTPDAAHARKGGEADDCTKGL